MATFKREIKKLPSEQNLRLLSSLVISLANKTSSVEDKCITPWKAEETYQKDVSLVIYNGYIYSCTVTNKDAVFTESHWMKLADNFDELSVEDVKAFLNLTPEEIQTLSSIILDTEVRLDKTYSSSKIYTDIQDALKEAKQYCITELAKKSTGSFKKANDTTEVTDGNYLYLILNPSTSKYDIYALVDSNVELLTSVEVNFDNYYTKTETDNSFLKKTDADGKYATITTVDGKVDKTDIVDNLTSTDTNKPLSANQGKVLKDEVDLKANDSEVVKKTDINKYSTDEQVVGTWIDGKPVYEKTAFSSFTNYMTGETSTFTIHFGRVNVISIDGMVNYDSAYPVPVNYYYAINNSTERITTFYSKDSGNMTTVIYSSNTKDYVNANYFVTIRYTKTTD